MTEVLTGSGHSDGRNKVVHVVEADQALRQSIEATLAEIGYQCQAFDSAAAYVAAPAPAQPACVVIDKSLPGLEGSPLQQRLDDPGRTVPMVVIGNHGGLTALERGSISKLPKPFTPQDLADAVQRTVRLAEARRRVHERFTAIAASVERLSPREKKVLNAIIAGQLNKAIARSLDVSVRTVEGDRAKIVEKFQAETTGEVVGKFAQYTLLTEIGYPEFGSSAFAM
ncbi:MAG: response regulator [Planctomycetota bacterium]